MGAYVAQAVGGPLGPGTNEKPRNENKESGTG